MKTILLTILITVFGAVAVQSQNTDKVKSTDCDKKILRKIKRKMAMVNFQEHIAPGQQAKLIVTCMVNDDKTISVTDVQGRNKEFNQEIIENLENHPVKCEWEQTGNEFSFVLTFKHVPL